jgi:hypothetical protein
VIKSVLLPRLGIFLLVTLILGVIGGILESNLVQGDYKSKYGTVRVPGSKVIQLPSGTIDVAYAVFLQGAGNETPDVPIPKNLGLDVKPVDSGVAAPAITRDVGFSANSSAGNTNTDIRIWKVDVSDGGDYRVTATGGASQLINQTLELGTGPAVPIGYVWLGAGVAGLLTAIFWTQIAGLYRRLRGSEDPDEHPPDHVKYGVDWDRDG